MYEPGGAYGGAYGDYGQARGEERTRERIRTLRRRMRACERDMDVSYDRLREWQRLRMEGWRRRPGESLKKTAATGAVTSVLVGREIKQERLRLGDLYAELYALEDTVQDELEALERGRREAAEEARVQNEQRKSEAEALRGQVEELRTELDRTADRALTAQARVQELYAELEELRQELEAQRDDRRVEATSVEERLANARAELEGYRVRGRHREERQDDEHDRDREM